MAEPFETLDARTPIVLLPVRLETRWFAGTPAEHELRVRIYPDAAHVTRKRDGVEASERAETEAYWRVRAADGEPAATTLSAWQSLSTTFGVPRAAWLVKTLEPRIEGATLIFPDVAASVNDAVDTTEATALPDRFIVMGYEGLRRIFAVTGQSVPPALPVGPADENDAARKWQITFDAAEAVGMAVRVRVSVALATRITRIAVVGVRESNAPNVSARLLADLVERHAIDRGASLLSAGTPTNHTATSRVGSALRPNGVAPPAGSDGSRVASALGLEPADVRWVANNERATDVAARTMNSVLWPATWEYFLEQFAAPLCNPAVRAMGQSLFIQHVRARGPFPTLTLGRQPYGILPVSPLRLWKNAQGQTSSMADLLTRLRGRWMAATVSAPRLPTDGDSMQTLVDILAMQPASVRWLGREASDVDIAFPRWLQDLGFEVPIQAQLDRLKQELVAEMVALGFPAASAQQLDPLIYAQEPYDVDLPLASRRGLTVFNPGVNPSTYLNAIAAASPEQLRTHAVAGSSPRTLLYLLVRIATLRVMARTAGELTAIGVIAPPAGGAPISRPDRAVVLDPVDSTRAKFDRAAPGFGNQKAGEILARADLPLNNVFDVLRSHRAALRQLAALPAADIERLAAESLDLASHRLDAWTTALATERLFATRAAGVRGAYVGAYGWVEGGRPPAQLARDGAAPVNASGHGFVHAPSLEQARTAAVLRAGFAARPTGDLAIDLSSDRVRRARWLLAQMSAGESLAALLGYRIERELVDRGLGPRIAGLRAQFPLAESEAGALAHSRLDGLAAHQAWSATQPETVLRPVAASIAELVDALADLLLAETVHQQVNGNAGAVAHLFDALEAGTAVPADPDVVRSPVPADAVTWQVVLSLDDAAPTWPGAAQSPRAIANPRLERWVESLMPPPATLRATVGSRDVPISIAALDLIALSSDRFSSSALATLIAGDADALDVKPNAALEKAHAIARAVQRALKSARPRGTSASWSARKDASIAMLSNDDLIARAIAAAPDEAIRIISGLPPEGESDAALTPSSELATPSARASWLSDLSRVRPAIEGLELIDLAQRLPIAAFKDTSDTGERRVVVIGATPNATGLRGLVLDEWKETTPRSEVTTGLAFHHDVPSSRAPQAILIAVPPDPTKKWSLDTLEATIAETIDLSFVRLARPANVWGTLLPAIYLAENLDDDTISTPLADSAVKFNVTES